MDEQQLAMYSYLWEDPNRYILVRLPAFSVDIATIHEAVTGSIYFLECDEDVYIEVLSRMRLAGVKEYDNLPPALLETKVVPKETGKEFLEWLASNERRRRNKKKK